MRQFNGAFQYLERTYNWWRYNFPEYVLPSSLPDPPGSPPTPPPWTLVPFAALLQRIPIWEMQLDNLLLFGHTMPTNAEVDFRKSYLEWCAPLPPRCAPLPPRCSATALPASERAPSTVVRGLLTTMTTMTASGFN